MSGEPSRKVRPDAVLRQLPEERQQMIFEELQKRSYSEVRKSLAADGIKCGCTALADFYHAYSAELRFRRAAIQRETAMEELQKKNPSMPLHEVEEFGDAIFLTSATVENDLPGYVKVRRITEAAKRTRLESRRISILEKKAAQLEQVEKVMDQKLNPEEQNRRLREILK